MADTIFIARYILEQVRQDDGLRWKNTAQLKKKDG
jgi:hypothetical protein